MGTGNWVRFVFLGASIISKTVAEAWRESSRRAAIRATQPAEAVTVGSISVDEAKLILGIKDEATRDQVRERYEHLFKANDKANGGSVYLQAKISNAKVCLDAVIKDDTSISKEE